MNERGQRIGVSQLARLQDLPVCSERELFARWRARHDGNAREELVRRHLPLARALAGRYRRTSEPFDDLLQVASLGLVNAIDRFDPDRGIAFKTFAVPTILGELKRYFRDTGWSVHLPRGLQELVMKVQHARAKLAAAGRSPTVAELAEYLEVDLEQVVEAVEAMASHFAVSLDAPIENGVDELTTYHDLVGGLEEGYPLVDASISLAAAVRELPEGDQRIVKLRFEDGLSQREIAGRIGVSQMQVSRILRRITDQLRQPMEIGHASSSRRAPRRRTVSVRRDT